MPSKPIIIKPLTGALFIVSLLVSVCSSYADTGERFLSIKCGDNALIVEPFIAWNEEVLKYSQALKQGVQVTSSTTIYYISNRFNQSEKLKCNVDGKVILVSLEKNELGISIDKHQLMHKYIDYVWEIYGPVYKIRYSNGRWSEYCGYIDHHPNWVAADFKKKDTNCKK